MSVKPGVLAVSVQWLTIDAGTVEDLAGLTRRTKTIAFDLFGFVSAHKNIGGIYQRTLRLRQLLQFMASLGSLLSRRTGRRSIGRDVVTAAMEVLAAIS